MDHSGEERDQMQEDIERLNLALQVESADFGIHEDETEDIQYDIEMCINEDSIDHEDYESISSAYSLNSEGKHEVPSEMDQVSGMSEISHLPVNAETCLALNRTYQELILESLKKIELALNENREKQKLLEEGLENKSKGSSKTADSSTTNKKKSSSLFCKPYFKDKDHKAAPPNSDVALKKSTQEQKQDITPPVPWSYAQRCKLEEAVKEEGLKQIILPLMNRKEVLVERVKNIETDLMRINLECSIEEEENSDGEEVEHLTEKRKMKESELTEWQQKIEELDKEIEKTKETSEIELLFGVDCEKVDWLMIANVIFAGKRDERECEIMWKNVLQPSINKEKWSTQETKQLQELVKKYNMRNWPAIAKELGTGRTPFQCLQFYQHNLNQTWDNRPWTEEEDEMLKEVVESVRVGKIIYFSQVSYFLDGRSKSQCMSRWNQINPNTKRGKWTLHEDCLLITAVQLHGTKSWSLIQEFVPGRTAVQCRERYIHSLDPSIHVPEKWTYEEDKKLLKLVNKQTEKAPGNSIKWVKLRSEFPGRTDHQLLSRYKRLQTWKMKSSWIADQTLQERQSMGVLEGAQLLQEITRKKPSNCLKEATKLFPDINKEDYIKQMEDKLKGELVVPRPPVVLRSTSRCFQAVWDRKKQLFNLVNQHLENVEKILPHHGTSIEEFKSFDNLNTGQQKTLQKVMSNRPNKITVKDMLHLSRRLAQTGNCKEARAKRQEKDTLFDDQAKDLLIWKCFHSLLVQKKIGRPRKFYLFSPTGRKPARADEDDEEDVEKITNITFTLLMNALDVDYKGALEKSRQIDEDNPALKEDIAFLKRITPNVLPSNITQKDPACTVNLGASSSQSQAVVNPVTSDSLVHQREPVNPDCPSKAQSTVTAADTRQSSVENEQNQSGSSLQPTREQQDAAAEAKADSRLARKRKESIGEDLDMQVQPKKLKTTPAEHKHTNGNSSVVVQGNNKACSLTTSKINKCPETEADKSVSSMSWSPSPSANPTTTPKGARIIKLPPGIKLKPGDKIQDILAAHKLSMESLQCQQPPSGPRPNSQSSQSQPNKQMGTVRKPSGATKSKNQKHGVVVIRPPSGLQDPERVKILPPGTITTSAFKSILQHRKYLMVKADPLYNKQFYKHRGEELQRRIELSKEADAEITKIESAKHAGALNETLNTAENSVVSEVAIKTAKVSQRSIVSHDALAKVRRTKEYKMLQRRFEALFAWPALLSTICPEHADNSLEETNSENPTTSNGQVLNEEKTQKAVKPLKRKVMRNNYPCVSSKSAWRKRVMSREKKKLKNEARWRKLRETREKKLRGEYIPKKYIRKKPVKTTAIRKSQRVASRIDSFQTKKGLSVFNERKMVIKEEQTSQQNNSSSCQIQPENVAIPVAFIGNISSSFVNNNGKNREEDHTVNMPQTHIEPLPTTSRLLPSALGNGEETVVTPSLPQEVVLPTMTVTDMHIQTLPSNSEHPVIIALLPSGSGQVIQTVENRPSQGDAVNNSYQYQNQD